MKRRKLYDFVGMTIEYSEKVKVKFSMSDYSQDTLGGALFGSIRPSNDS